MRTMRQLECARQATGSRIRVTACLFGLIGAYFLLASISHACESDYLIWIPRSPDADPLYRFVKYSGEAPSGKAGYIDATGKVVIPLSIPYWGGNSGGEFHDGLLEIAVGDGVYVNTLGLEVIGRKFERGWTFSEGLAAALDEHTQKWGYINQKGAWAIQPQFASYPSGSVDSFQDGLAMVEVDGRYGYIGRSGKFAILPQFPWADSFSDGMARVVVEGPCIYFLSLDEAPCGSFGIVPRGTKDTHSLSNCGYTYVGKSGIPISQQRFDLAKPFSEDLAPVKIAGAWGFIDKQGRMAIAPQFETAAPFADGLAKVSTDKRFGYIDHTGTLVIQPQYDYAEDFAEGLAVVGSSDSGYWYIDYSGHQAIPRKFLLASPFFKGLAHVKLDGDRVPIEIEGGGTFAYINHAGTQVFTYKP